MIALAEEDRRKTLTLADLENAYNRKNEGHGIESFVDIEFEPTIFHRDTALITIHELGIVIELGPDIGEGGHYTIYRLEEQ